MRPFPFSPHLLAFIVAAFLTPAGYAQVPAGDPPPGPADSPARASEAPVTTTPLPGWSPKSVPPNYSVAHWDKDDGLPQNTVKAILQAQDGAIWVATNEGVARFDGVQFTAYSRANTRGYPNANATSIAEGGDGTIWVGTESGLVAVHDGKAKRYMHREGLLSQTVTATLAAPDGSVWIGTSSGLNRWANGTLTALTEDDGLAGHGVLALSWLPSGDLWIGTSQGPCVLHDQTITTETLNAKFNSHQTRLVFVEKSGARWLVTNAEIVRLEGGDAKRFTENRGMKPSSVTAIAQDHEGRMWFGTTSGLMVQERGKFVRPSIEQLDPHDPVQTIVCDREGNLWIGGSAGLTRLSRTAFTAFGAADGLPPAAIASLCEDTKGRLWLGTADRGLVRIDDRSVTVFGKRSALAGDNIRALHATRDGGVWVGFSGAVPVFIQGDTITPHPEIADAVEKTVHAIFEDSRGTLWIGAGTGLWTRTGDRFEKHTGPNNIRLVTRQFAEDAHGTVWAATNRGLAHFTAEKMDLLGTKEGLPADNVHAVSCDPDGTLWIGMTATGLCWLHDGHFASCTTKQGLPSDAILSLVDDGHGNLWVCTPQGISQIAKAELKELAAGSRSQVDAKTYSRLDRVRGTQVSTVGSPAGIRSASGRLWFATVKSLVTVDPTHLPHNDVPPPVLISSVSIEGRETPPEPEIIVPPGTSDLEINYTALSFAQPEKIRFRYQLEGVNAGWVDAGSRRVATYSRVPPGVRAFRVQAMNNDNVWSDRDASVTFMFKPRFYQTWWFYGAAAASVGLIAVGTHSLRTRALRRRERQLLKLVEERTAHLEAQIAERKRAERELIAVSRIAGMAEVATNVLHNVGNVLNSVNVSATVATDLARDTRVENLGRIARMLEEHQTDLATFLTQDTRGKSLPTYLSKLAEHLGTNQAAVLAELNQLRKNVEHIKVVVSMQQSIARIGGVAEELSLADVLEDTLTINADSLARHEIEFVRDFRQRPVVVTDRHKLVQILLNLVENAKHACRAVEGPGRRIVLRLDAEGDTARISVIDNGEGIAPENLTRIFAHGFTTRKTGHGFGLHSSALIAKELGGKIVARSEGAGRGAEFIVELPLKRLLES